MLPGAFREQHNPILIEENEDFESQEWSGSGTVDDPYLVSGLSIVSNDICISIEDTTAHFIIQDCYISSNDFLCAVYFYNVENGEFTNNEVVDSEGHGILIDYCENVVITSNSIHNNGHHGISFFDVMTCVISSNDIDSNSGSGISLSFVNEYQISSNTITNNGEWGLLLSDSDGNVESNNIFQGNELGSIEYQSC